MSLWLIALILAGVLIPSARRRSAAENAELERLSREYDKLEAGGVPTERWQEYLALGRRIDELKKVEP